MGWVVTRSAGRARRYGHPARRVIAVNIGLLVGGLALATVGLCCVVAAVVVLRRRGTRSRDQRPAPAEERLCDQCHRPLPPGAEACPLCSPTPAASPPSAPEQAQGPLPAPEAALIGLTGALAQQVFRVWPAPRGLTVGRSTDNDVVISDMLISRYHAQVVPEGDDIVLYDRNSANGTLVNGQRVVRHVLQHGDVIQLCGTEFVFSHTGQAVTPARPRREPPPEEAPVPSPEGEFAGYRLEELLGQGGISVVYRALAPDGTPVALKILNVTDEYIVRKFMQEQQIGQVLAQHPYIRQVHALGQNQERLYLVMEYVDGWSLRKRVGALAEEEIVRIVGQTCQALAFAHDHNIIHRDVKPENILVARDGTVKVTDFGIAKLTSAVTITRDRVVGTPEYLSPEQARGDDTIGPAADIYSLGVVLYELLVGQVPFPLARHGSTFRETVEVLRHHIHTPPPPPRARNPQVNPTLEKVALKALEKDPRRRYANALAMAEALGYHERPPALSAPAVARLGLVVMRGARSRCRFEVQGEGLVIGRADLDPEDVLVSRRHVLLTRRGSGLWLQDTSLNGTRVNGKRVFGEVLLQRGDEIEIGQSVLRVVEHTEDDSR